jgi:hypothetical protein
MLEAFNSIAQQWCLLRCKYGEFANYDSAKETGPLARPSWILMPEAA